MRHVVPFLLAIVVLGAMARPAPSDEPVPPSKAPGALRLTTERVVVFKDGFALFVKRAEGAADVEGRLFTEEVPDEAVLGTFWATSAEGRILSMHAGWTQREVVTERLENAASVLDLLRANVGRKVVLGTTRENASPIEATVEEVLDLAPPGTPDPRAASYVVLGQGEESRLVLPIAEVRTVAGSGLATKVTRVAKTVVRAKRLTFDLGKEAAEKPTSIRILYFRPGLRWIPTYRLSGDLEERGDLALQAEVIDEAEDLRDVAVDLVVGVPNFRYRDVPSPLTLEVAMHQVLRQEEMGQLLAQRLVSNRFQTDERGDERSGEEALRMARDLAASGSQDLFVYHAPPLSLARGERATLGLWSAPVGLRHLYTFDLPIVRDGRSGDRLDMAPERNSPLRLARNDVWHQVEMANATEVPWTTGPVMLLRGDVPLGQELIGYTARGAKVLVPVTVATDIQGTYKETEVERKPDALVWNRVSFASIRKTLQATVTNRSGKTAVTRVTVSTGGVASNASAGGTIEADDFHSADWGGSGFGPVNAHSTVVWNVTLEPGQSSTFTCEVLFYVP